MLYVGSWLPRASSGMAVDRPSHSIQCQSKQHPMVTGALDSKIETVDFLITVSTNDSVLSCQKTWRVTRTFMQFHQLHMSLLSLLGRHWPSSIPPFPDPTNNILKLFHSFCPCIVSNNLNNVTNYFFQNDQDEICDTLRVKLENWLKEVSLCVFMMTYKASRDRIFEFLNVEANVSFI